MRKIGQLNENRSEMRSFSDVKRSSRLMSQITKSSRSKMDAEVRIQAFTKAQDNLDQLISIANRKTKSRTRMHSASGLGDLSGLNSRQFIDVTLTSLISGLTGFLAVERGMDSTEAKLAFVNVLNVKDDSMVSSNLGPSTGVDSSKVVYRDDSTTGTDIAFSASANVVPGSVKVSITQGGTKYRAIDDSNGELMAPAGLGMTEGTINYSTGAVTIKLGTALAANDSYVIELIKDTPKEPINRVKGGLGYWDLVTHPEIIISENNLITDLVAEKSIGVDMAEVLKKRVTDEYTKMSNKAVIDPIVQGYTGNTTVLDISAYTPQYSQFESYMRLFHHGLNQIDTELTDKTHHTVHTSVYLVGNKIADLFKSMRSLDMFEANKDASYITDLIGHFDGIPVIKSNHVGENDGYAIHKTAGGELAPVARGIFLPVNDLPEVGNFNNPAQFAGGVYSYEGTRLLTSDLVQKFTVTMPDGFDLVS